MPSPDPASKSGANGDAGGRQRYPRSAAEPRSRHSVNHESAVSRFACRIHVDREPPYTARLYAAGFDASKNIFLGVCSIYFVPIFLYLSFNGGGSDLSY